MEQFSLFFTYACEYRALCLEQISEEEEKLYLSNHPDISSRKTPYRVLAKFCNIKDLKGQLFVREPNPNCWDSQFIGITDSDENEETQVESNLQFFGLS